MENKSPIPIPYLFFCFTLLLMGTLESCSEKEGQYLTDSGEFKSLPDKVDFNFHIKPILSDRCFACHGPDENTREANLRLDIKEGAFAKLENSDGYAIVPGKASRSKLLDRVHSVDPEIKMPPPESKLSISEYEIALLERWIEEGAEWKSHWSFIPPERPELPKVVQKNWPGNAIDHFVLSTIEKEGLNPSSPADKEKLLRRLTFDLTGLPPALEEIDDFIADDSDEAYEKVVDRLLNNPRFGERMASDWLDVARYADTHGYQGDTHRRMWPWRDWVINAFNANMPYDQFVTRQLAGDQLPNPTREQLIATGFNRNHMMNGEGGIIDEEYRVEYVADRANTTGKAIMGLTMECARCHDHKYDPISQKEYFGLYAFYNNVDEKGMTVNEAENYPSILLTTEQDEAVLDSLDGLIDNQRKDIEDYIKSLKADESWKGKVKTSQINLNKGLLAHLTFDQLNNQKGFTNIANRKIPAAFPEPNDLVEGPVNKAVSYDGNNGVLFLKPVGNFEFTQEFSFSMWVKFPEAFPRADILHKLEFDFMGEKGYHLYINHEHLSFQMNNAWDNNYIKVTTQDTFPFDKWTHITLTYDGSGLAKGIEIALDAKKAPMAIIHDNIFKTINGYGGLNVGGANFAGGAIDEFRVYDRKLTLPEIRKLAKITEPRDEGWFAYYLFNQDKEYREKSTQLSGLLESRMKVVDTIPEFMVMQDLRDSIRPTYILNRGAYDDPGERVAHATPAKLLPFPEDLPQNRLGLAKWFFHPEHPLTSRVMVNRLWQLIFGKGLVATPDDFGNQGSLPTHPELLDWLAMEFQENDWDIKAMLKLMVMSSTYRQSSKITPEALEKDKYNQFLARGPRYRLPAEMIRDNALSVSGLLVEKRGGPSVKPYQPPGLWAEKSSSLFFFYKQNHGDSLYRRSLYTYWRRTTPPPNMITFDSPTRNICTVKREATSTPLQALVLLNDIQFVEAARVFAERIIKEGGDQPENRIRHAFRLATTRTPSEKELSELQLLLNKSTAEFEKNSLDAEELLKIGEHPMDKNLDRLEVAAYTVMASAILNLDETITKG